MKFALYDCNLKQIIHHVIRSGKAMSAPSYERTDNSDKRRHDI